MIRTWMDCIIAFAFVGITFEMIENVAFGVNHDLPPAEKTYTGHSGSGLKIKRLS